MAVQPIADWAHPSITRIPASSAERGVLPIHRSRRVPRSSPARPRCRDPCRAHQQSYALCRPLRTRSAARPVVTRTVPRVPVLPCTRRMTNADCPAVVLLRETREDLVQNELTSVSDPKIGEPDIPGQAAIGRQPESDSRHRPTIGGSLATVARFQIGGSSSSPFVPASL
jgi:hypothetical protein